jgi:hypothetical protein
MTSAKQKICEARFSPSKQNWRMIWSHRMRKALEFPVGSGHCEIPFSNGTQHGTHVLRWRIRALDKSHMFSIWNGMECALRLEHYRV